MKIPEPLQDPIRQFIEKDKDLRAMVGMATVMGNTSVVNSVMQIGVTSAIEQVIKPNPFFPDPADEEFSGSILFGQGNGFTPRRRKEDLRLHYGCRGTTGSGKSTQNAYFMLQFSEQGIKFINLEFKRDLCCLCRRMPLLNFIVGPDPNFKLPIFQPPPGVHPTVWDAAITKVFGITQYIAEAGQNLMLETLTQLRKEGKPVTPFTLYERIRRTQMASARGFAWRESLVNRWLGLISTCGDLLDVTPDYRFPLEKLGYPLNFQFDQVTSDYSSLLGTYPILYLYYHRISNNLRVGSPNEPPLIVYMCDESASLINKKMEFHALGEHPLLQLVRLSREFNFSFFLWSSSSFPTTLREQINFKGLQRVVDFEGLMEMARDMGLSQEVIDIVRDFPPGYTILKFPEISACLSYFPNVPLAKDITRKEIDENNKALLKGTEFEKVLWNREEKPIPLGDGTKEEKEATLTTDEHILMRDVYNHPFVATVARFEDLGFSVGKGSRLVDGVDGVGGLISRGLLDKVEVNVAGRGGTTKFLILTTEKGFEAIRMPIKKGISKGGGFIHTFFQYSIGKHFAKIADGKVSAEKNLNGKFVDILIELPDGRLVAIEVAMSSAHEKANIELDLKSGVSLVIVGCYSKKVAVEVYDILTYLDATTRNKVRVCLLQELLRIERLDLLIEA